MSALGQVLEVLSRGIDDAALGFARAYEVLRRPRKLQLVEQADGAFALRPVGKARPRAAVEPRLRIEDGEFLCVSSQQAQNAAREEPGRTGPGVFALCVPRTRAAAPRGRVSRRHRARANRPPDALEAP